jgi:hypothetical protein
MPVPKLVCEVSDASGFAWPACVEGGLRCEEHDEEAELSVERYFGQSAQVVLGQACQVLEPAEDSFARVSSQTPSLFFGNYTVKVNIRAEFGACLDHIEVAGRAPGVPREGGIEPIWVLESTLLFLSLTL